MKRKIWAVLMALVLVVGVVPTVAKAGETECMHSYFDYGKNPVAKGEYNGDGTHNLICWLCGEKAEKSAKCNAADKNYDSICDYCLGEYKKPAHTCTYEAGVTSNGDETHNVNCSCGKFMTLNCTDNNGDGKCDSCGYQKYDHEHDYVAKSNEDGTHNLVCVCGEALEGVDCSDNDGDGKCDSCGYEKYVAPEDEHEHNFVTHSLENGKHEVSCTCGARYVFECEKNDDDGVCDSCGYVFPEEPVTPHEHNYVPHSNNDGTHNLSCNCGNEVKNLNCSDNDGDKKCDSCGYEKYVAPEEEHNHNYVAHSNNDGTHTSSCNCGLEVKLTCADNDGDGKCDACGYQKYVAPEGEHEHNYVAHSNKNGTHNMSCNCGLEVKDVTCLDNDGDGKCDACGYQKYTAPENEHEHNYVAHSNNDGTHLLTCNCGLEVKNVTCLDNDGDGKCDSCGYQKYVETCKHEMHAVKDNKDGLSHNIVCFDCGKTLEVKVAHEYKDGVCACGAITEVPEEDDKEEDKPVVTPGEDDKEEDKPVVTPEEDADDADDSKDTAANEDAELDEVPETGNGGVVTALISLVVVGLAGVLVFLQANKRKGM